ncbi:MAG TPA: alkaline phosphatase D family protein [Solirubrobacteraceae bacterium]|nr:alkaline phosphatase D family protein [Solirubrobacteraceae bacterium]
MQTRRRFLTAAGGFVAATVVAPLWGGEALGARRRVFRGGKFAEGVMSGDPTPNAITLWTRVHDVAGGGTVRLEVARERSFRKLVAAEEVPTSGGADHAVKVRVGGLKPHEQYWYRFATAGTDSDVGRFRTAPPPDSNVPITFAFWSCQDYTGGYYNAQAQLAREDVDFMVNLGDYIYADRQHEPPGAGGDDLGLPGRVDPVEQARSLKQYRDKYKLYRTDANLRRMQAAHAMVTTWDDHEVTDDYAGASPDTIPANAFTRRQQLHAYQAFFESMPVFSPNRRTQLFRALRFGRNVDLLVLDERQYRDAQPCGDPLVGNLDPSSPSYCSNLNDPRTMLGAREGGFLDQRLAASGARWKVIANEVPMTPIKLVQAFVGPDDWAGYTQARTQLVQTVQGRPEPDIVFVTGDIHTFVTSTVPVSIDDPTPVAPEFVGGSLTSFGFGEVTIDVGGGITLHGTPDNPGIPQNLQDTLLAINPWAVDTDSAHHGYGVATFARNQVTCEYVRVATTRQRGARAIEPLRYVVPRGARVPQKVS